MTEPAYWALVPRDGFFCKDGRGWHTSSSGRGHTLEWPHPSTLLGAVRTACGRTLEASGERLDGEAWRQRTAGITLGASFALRRPMARDWSAADRVWPVPKDALWLEGHPNVVRLRPRPPRAATLGTDDDEAREALWVPNLTDPSKPLAAPAWWQDQVFMRWLMGGDVTATLERLQPKRRVQAHVGIRAEEQTADDGVLFSHDVMETLDGSSVFGDPTLGTTAAEWALGCEVAGTQSMAPRVATLGSDGRLARIQNLPAQLFEAPAALLGACNQSAGLRVVLTTPAEFGRGWLPDGLVRHGKEYRGQLGALQAEVTLRAALVPRPIHISGWDMVASQPKPTSRLVPSGAVYFFEKSDGQPFDATDAQRLWLSALGSRQHEGFGRVVPGPWAPDRG